MSYSQHSYCYYKTKINFSAAELNLAETPQTETHGHAKNYIFWSFFFSKGKLEALAILLQKLRSDGRRVLIFTQMVKMLDILEAFLDHRQLTYVRVDESFTPDERQVKSPSK